MSRIDTKEVAALMKRCKIGVGGRNAMEQAHEIMADCYGTLGALSSERDALRAQVAEYQRAFGKFGTEELKMLVSMDDLFAATAPTPEATR